MSFKNFLLSKTDNINFNTFNKSNRKNINNYHNNNNNLEENMENIKIDSYYHDDNNNNNNNIENDSNDIIQNSNIFNFSSISEENMQKQSNNRRFIERKPLEAIDDNSYNRSNTKQNLNNLHNLKSINIENDGNQSINSISNPQKSKLAASKAFDIFNPKNIVNNSTDNENNNNFNDDNYCNINQDNSKKSTSKVNYSKASYLEDIKSKIFIKNSNNNNDIYEEKNNKIHENIDLESEDKFVENQNVLLLPNNQNNFDFSPIPRNSYNYHNFLNMYIKQFHYLPSALFMSRQKDINCSMRYKLVDWIIEVTEELLYKRQTLFLCINIIDRFLSKLKIQRSKLQLLGTTALLIASKFEEINPHPVKMFAHLTENSYSEQEILKMERIILRTIKFDLCTPSISNFTEFGLISLLIDDLPYLQSFIEYIEELILVDYNSFSPHPHSHLAFASIILALHCFNYHPWPKNLERLCEKLHIQYHDLLPAIFEIYKALRHAKEKRNTINAKYLLPDRHHVGNTELPQTFPIVLPID